MMPRRAMGTVIAVIGVMLVLGLGAWLLPGEQDAEVILDPTCTYQTMKGWEVTLRFWEQDKAADRYDSSWRDYKEKILERLVNELGINGVRLEIKSGAENPVDYWTDFENQRIGYREVKRHRFEKINDNADPEFADPSGFQFSELAHQVSILLPIKRLLEARGEKLFVTLTYVDFGNTGEKGDLSHALQPEEYAELIIVTFRHLADAYDITPDALEIILEPDNTDHWRGRQIGAAMVAAVRRLNEADFFPDVIAPSTAYALVAGDYFDEVMEVPGAAEAISTLSYHRYDPAGAGLALPGIHKRAQHHGLDTAMLEHLQGDVAELYEDLTRANVSSWQQWAIATDSSKLAARGGYHYLLDSAGHTPPAIVMAPRTRELAPYFQLIRAGAVRIEASSSSTDKKVVAFRNTDGAHAVIVQADRPGRLFIVGLPAGDYGIRYTTADETGRELAAVELEAGRTLTAYLPAKGVMTFYQRQPSESQALPITVRGMCGA